MVWVTPYILGSTSSPRTSMHGSVILCTPQSESCFAVSSSTDHENSLLGSHSLVPLEHIILLQWESHIQPFTDKQYCMPIAISHMTAPMQWCTQTITGEHAMMLYYVPYGVCILLVYRGHAWMTIAQYSDSIAGFLFWWYYIIFCLRS
jgi:hypothetical protein